jgi:hypothetical protein
LVKRKAGSGETRGIWQSTQFVLAVSPQSGAGRATEPLWWHWRQRPLAFDTPREAESL